MTAAIGFGRWVALVLVVTLTSGACQTAGDTTVDTDADAAEDHMVPSTNAPERDAPRALGRSTGPTTSSTPDSSERSLLELDIGDCVDLPELGQPGSTETGIAHLRNCDEPHDAQIYARLPLVEDPGAEYPGTEAVLDLADNICLAAFEGYVGARYVDTGYEIVHLSPPEAAWIRDDRIVVCAVIDAGFEPLVGSIAASAP